MVDDGTRRGLERLLALIRRVLAEYRRTSQKTSGPSRPAPAGTKRPSARKRRRSSQRSADRGSPSAPVRSPASIEISYSPQHDGEADPGEVVWAWVPYEDDPAQGKDRPVLIIGRTGDRLAGVPLSSRDRGNGRHADEWVPVGTGAWDAKGRPSHAHASRVLTFEPGEIRREGSALDRRRFDEVVARVQQRHV